MVREMEEIYHNDGTGKLGEINGSVEKMELNIEWTNDCSGKKDYDGPILRVSTRYWPRGGGYFTLNSNVGVLQGNETRPEIKPSARSSILLSDDLEIAEQKFEGETEEEVKTQVEKWVQLQYERILKVIALEFLDTRITSPEGNK